MKCTEFLRDCQAWNDEKLPLSTCSNEAAKLFDAGLHQYVGWFEDESFNGLAGTCKKMLDADDTFIMGKVLTYGLDLMGTGKTSRLDKTFAKQLSDLQNECRTNVTVTDREKMHVNAINTFAEGNLSSAAEVWEDILLDHPTDLLALKFAHDTYFYLGDQCNIRDSIARVLPSWNPNLPLYGYVKGMLSFGQEETNLFTEAELSAKEPCGLLACHLYWHWSLYAVEKGDYEIALRIYDEEIKKSCSTSGAILDMVDATSLLYRLQLEGVDVADRWHDVKEICRPHVDDHILAFNDAHFLMSFLGAKSSEFVKEQLQSTEKYLTGNKLGKCGETTKKIGLKIFHALVDYDNGNYSDVVDSLHPIRHKISKIGGSHVQRDIFNQVIIHSCLKSSNRKHNLLARSLLCERKVLKPNSPLTDRLIARLLSCHVD